MKKILSIMFVLLASFVLSGCSLSQYAPKATTTTEKIPSASSFLKSTDNGSTWEAKMQMEGGKDISGANVLSVAVHPTDAEIIYVGTEKNGILLSKDGAQTWTSVPFAEKVYGIAIDQQNPQIVYAAGFNNNRGKIYKREAEDKEWKEIYTEPSDGTFVTSLTMDKHNSKVLYAGTNQGVIFKTVDGGATWINLKKADMPIVSIAVDATNSNLVYFGLFQRGIWRSKNAGTEIEDVSGKINSVGQQPLSAAVYSLVADPWVGGRVYAGTERGLIRSNNGGDNWEPVNIIDSSKEFPIRAISINPFNSKEIIYSNAKAIYKSTDTGSMWSTFQLNTKRDVSVIRYSAIEKNVVYIGMRSF